MGDFQKAQRFRLQLGGVTVTSDRVRCALCTVCVGPTSIGLGNLGFLQFGLFTIWTSEMLFPYAATVCNTISLLGNSIYIYIPNGNRIG